MQPVPPQQRPGILGQDSWHGAGKAADDGLYTEWEGTGLVVAE